MLRSLFRKIDPGTVGRRAELFVGRLGSFETPTVATIVSNYLRGFVLFGRPNTYGARFTWHWFPARAIITSDTANVPKKLRPYQRRGELEVRYDQDFEAIINYRQQGRDGWLTPELVEVYIEVQKLGFVATVGTYRDGRLVGGLWGLEIGRVFSIMSMFHLENHAGALALAALVDIVVHEGRWSIIDCGTLKANWQRYGAREIPVQEFSELVIRSLKSSMSRAGWAATLPELDGTSRGAESSIMRSKELNEAEPVSTRLR